MGTVSLGFSPSGELGEPHPIEATVHAGPLAFPIDLWSTADRRSAKRYLRWTERLLLALARETHADYGAIGMEAAFPTPSQLMDQSLPASWPSTWFWSSELGSRASAEEAQLLSTLPPDAVTESDFGMTYHGWPFGGTPSDKVVGSRNVLRFLTRALPPLR